MINELNNHEGFPSIEEKNWKLANLTGLPKEIFAENRTNFLNNIKKRLQYDNNSCIILEGGKELPRYDTDVVCYHFIQESNFYYLTGVTEPNFTFIFDLKDEKPYLFMKLPDLRTKIFMNVPSLTDVFNKYSIECYDIKDLPSFITNKQYNKIYAPKGTNTDSGLEFKIYTFGTTEEELALEKIYDRNEGIYECLVDTRTTKNQGELSIMRFASKVTVDAHVEVLKGLKVGLNERDIENIFYSYLRTHYYSRETPYGPICGCGINGATLHYQKNDESLVDGELLLFDMGFRIGGYCSDVTSTVPINGKFTERQKVIYDAVLNANREVMKNLKAGVSWTDMHIIAERVILAKLQEVGILNDGFSIDEMIEDRVYFYFQPHGLGHLIGLDVHDAGGYLSFTNQRSTEPGKRSLRTARIMEEGTVITVEPGCYFIKFHLENAFANEKVSKYFNKTKCIEYYNFGGIRLEDVVVVQKNGCFNLCKELPRTTEEIEAIMNK